MSRAEGSAQSAAGSGRQPAATPAKLRDVLDAATSMPIPWIIVTVVIAVVASFDVTVSGGSARWHFAVGATSLAALGFIWLPTALRLLSLVGGTVNVGAVQASATGLLQSPDELIELLASVRATTETLGRGEGDKLEGLRSVESDVDKIAERYVAADESINDDVLSRLARDYERIRRDQPRGDPRTVAMNRLVNEVKIRAKAAPAAAAAKAGALLRSPADGDRIVGLALCEASPSPANVEAVLAIFSSAHTAFEQYHSLLALDALVDQLDPAQRAMAERVLIAEKADPRGVGLMDDPYIPRWIDKVLGELTART